MSQHTQRSLYVQSIVIPNKRLIHNYLPQYTAHVYPFMVFQQK